MIRKNNSKYRKQAFSYSIPSLTGFTLFYVIPFIWSLYYAVIDNVFKNNFVGMQNFYNLFMNEFYVLALINTLTFTLISVVLLVVFSVICTFLFVYAGSIIYYFRFAFLLPYFLPTASTGFIFYNIFNSNGKLNIIQLYNLNFFERLFSPQMIPLLVILLWKYTGLNIVILTSAINSIDDSIYEAASLDGASGASLHRHITMPLINRTFFFVIVLSVMNSFNIYKEIYYLFPRDYPPDSVYMLQHFINNNFRKLSYQNLSAGTLIFAILVLFIIYMLYYKTFKTLND
jgi:multiple sugar transport system permease protein